LQEKFFLPCRILEAKSYNAALKQSNCQPFHVEDIIICSYQFARSKAADIAATHWDLVVMDEAHRLRNVYKPSNVIANTLKQALQDVPKLLLTATPLQNSLLELYGLVSCIDERTFGDLKSFREQFANLHNSRVFEVLKARLQPVCKRTLRRQVLPDKAQADAYHLALAAWHGVDYLMSWNCTHIVSGRVRIFLKK